MIRERDQLGHVGWSPDYGREKALRELREFRGPRPTVVLDQRQQLSADLLALVQRARAAGLRLCVAVATPHGRVAGDLTADTFMGVWPVGGEPAGG